MTWRKLTSIERGEAFGVFGESLDYDRIQIDEGAGWTDALLRLHAWLGGRPRPTQHNAVTLGHRIFFPRPLDSTAEALLAGRFGDTGWLMHELTHVWQAERIGARYLWLALRAQLAGGEAVYDYGGEEGLLAATLAGSGFETFSVEQQAEIVRDAYLRRRRGVQAHAWEAALQHLLPT